MIRQNIREIFTEVYRAFPANLMGHKNIDISNNIILPKSALDSLSNISSFNDSKNPILFVITNLEFNKSTHCGVSEFTAYEGTCYLPSNIFERLSLEKGQQVCIRNVDLKPGKYIKLQPHKTEFIKNQNIKQILEMNLRNYFYVTEGDTISVKLSEQIFKLDIVECKPAKAIRSLNTDIEIDFARPKDGGDDGEEVVYNHDNIVLFINFNIIFNSNEKVVKPLTKEEIKETKFYGHNFRIDGKEDTNTQLNEFKKTEFEKDDEENYYPQECRIPCNPRPCFNYVNL